MAASGAHITFTSGGVVSGTLVSINGTASSTVKLYKAPPPKPLCKARRGGPRSRVFCEVYKEIPHEWHHGRGQAKWFSWKDRNAY